MTNLTDKWEKGELPVGFYYYTTIFSPTVYIQNFTIDVIKFQDFKEIVAEVLAPVPTYDEYQKLLSDQLAKNEAVEINAELEAENTKLKTENKWYSEQLNEAVKEVGHLKELLTMVKPVLQLEYNVTENRNLIKKIKQALGEE